MTDNKPIQLEETPKPQGDLALQTLAMPKDTNASGDIFGGWLVSQMDLAGAITAEKIAKGRVATVAIEGMAFLSPVNVGSTVSCYTQLKGIGRSSMTIQVEVWIKRPTEVTQIKVTEGIFVFVAIDSDGRTRPVILENNTQ